MCYRMGRGDERRGYRGLRCAIRRYKRSPRRWNDTARHGPRRRGPSDRHQSPTARPFRQAPVPVGSGPSDRHRSPSDRKDRTPSETQVRRSGNHEGGRRGRPACRPLDSDWPASSSTARCGPPCRRGSRPPSLPLGHGGWGGPRRRSGNHEGGKRGRTVRSARRTPTKQQNPASHTRSGGVLTSGGHPSSESRLHPSPGSPSPRAPWRRLAVSSAPARRRRRRCRGRRGRRRPSLGRGRCDSDSP